jgi:hypothetical protein
MGEIGPYAGCVHAVDPGKSDPFELHDPALLGFHQWFAGTGHRTLLRQERAGYSLLYRKPLEDPRFCRPRIGK